MIPIPLLYMFGGKTFITSVEISKMTRHFSKANTLRDVNAKKVVRGTSPSNNGKLTMSISK